MKTVSGKRLAKLAEERGWVLARVSGSHHFFIQEGRTERLVIPIHGNQDLKAGLQRAPMRLIPVADADL